MLNLPSDDMVEAVNRPARTTGSDPVPDGKAKRGYRHVKPGLAPHKLRESELAKIFESQYRA